MPLTLAALKTELQTDPTGLGYTLTNLKNTAAIINLVRAGISINRGIISSYEVVGATIFSELTALTALNREIYGIYTGAGQIDVANAEVVNVFAGLFGAGTTTRTQLNALRTRTGSRAEQLFGINIIVTPSDCRAALAS